MKSTSCISEKVEVPVDRDILRDPWHAFQSEAGAVYSFMHLPKQIQPDIFRMVDKQPVKFLEVLQGFKEYVSVPYRL